MAAVTLNTLGQCARHHMLVRADCVCGNRGHYRSIDLLMEYGGGWNPYRMPKLTVWRPMKFNGKRHWVVERLK